MVSQTAMPECKNSFGILYFIARSITDALTDDEYFMQLPTDRIPTENYELKKGKNNIVLERYPKLTKDIIEENESELIFDNEKKRVILKKNFVKYGAKTRVWM